MTLQNWSWRLVLVFIRCLNVPLLRLRTLALLCPTVHGARQRRLYRALAVFDCRLLVKLWRRPEALSRWGCVACCWPIVSYNDKGAATDQEDAPRVLTARRLPAWWGVDKQALLSICCKSARKRIWWGGGGKGEGTRCESYITCYVAHSNDYVMYYAKQAFVFLYNVLYSKVYIGCKLYV